MDNNAKSDDKFELPDDRIDVIVECIHCGFSDCIYLPMSVVLSDFIECPECAFENRIDLAIIEYLE